MAEKQINIKKISLSKLLMLRNEYKSKSFLTHEDYIKLKQIERQIQEIEE